MLAALGVLLAAEIILSRFMSITAWNIKLGFSFVPVAVAAMLYGPLPAALVAALGDFLGALLFPIGPYFPGFTLTAFLTGLTFGALLYRKRTAARAALAVAIVQLPLGLLLNTLWISLLYGSPFLPLLATRAAQAALMGAVQFVTLRLLSRLPEQMRGGIAA